MPRPRLLALAPLVTAASLFAQAPLSLDSAQSLTFSRVWYADDSSPSAPPAASAQATVSVDPREVFALAREAWAPDSLLHTYLNIWVADRWIVQNRVLDEVALAALESRPPGEPSTGDFVYSYTFRLEGTLPGEPVLGETEFLEAYAEVRVSPGGAGGPPTLFDYVVEAEVRPLTCFDPDDDLLDAIDDDGERERPEFPDSDPAVPALPPEKVPERVEHVTQAAGNLQAAKNQCGPMAVANSLAYLDERFQLGVPHEHKQGQGTGADDSLVGELDRATGRGVTDRANGDPLRGDSLVRGKFKYLADNGLTDRLAHEHRGLLVDEFGDSGDFTAHGSTSVRTGEPEDITWEWLCDRLKTGADVEIEFVTSRSENRIGVHMVRVIGCGEEGWEPDKKRWIRYVDDSVQGDDTNSLSVTETYVTQAANGRLKVFPYGEIWFAMAETEKPADDSLPRMPATRREFLVDAGSFGEKADFFSAGSIATIFGRFPVTASAAARVEQAAALPTSLNGVEVWVDGRMAPLFFAGEGQINFQIPAETRRGAATLVVYANGLPSEIITVGIAGANPSIFTIPDEIAGPNRGAVQNQDFSLNTPANPAPPGGVLIVYFSGGGELDPPIPSGQPAPADPLARLTNPALVTVGGVTVETLFAGATPEFAGLLQANVLLPEDLPAGEHALTIEIEGSVSNGIVVSVGE